MFFPGVWKANPSFGYLYTKVQRKNVSWCFDRWIESIIRFHFLNLRLLTVSECLSTVRLWKKQIQTNGSFVVKPMSLTNGFNLPTTSLMGLPGITTPFIRGSIATRLLFFFCNVQVARNVVALPLYPNWFLRKSSLGISLQVCHEVPRSLSVTRSNWWQMLETSWCSSIGFPPVSAMEMIRWITVDACWIVGFHMLNIWCSCWKIPQAWPVLLVKMIPARRTVHWTVLRWNAETKNLSEVEMVGGQVEQDANEQSSWSLGQEAGKLKSSVLWHC